jgi:hypothetical protein
MTKDAVMNDSMLACDVLLREVGRGHRDVAVVGEIGSGKSLLCRQIARRFVAKGKRVVIVSDDRHGWDRFENIEHWRLDRSSFTNRDFVQVTLDARVDDLRPLFVEVPRGTMHVSVHLVDQLAQYVKRGLLLCDMGEPVTGFFDRDNKERRNSKYTHVVTGCRVSDFTRLKIKNWLVLSYKAGWDSERLDCYASLLSQLPKGRGLGIGFHALHGHDQGLFTFENDRWTLEGLQRCN